MKNTKFTRSPAARTRQPALPSTPEGDGLLLRRRIPFRQDVARREHEPGHAEATWRHPGRRRASRTRRPGRKVPGARAEPRIPRRCEPNRRRACAAPRPGGEQRIIGRVVDRVGEAEQREARDEQPEAEARLAIVVAAAPRARAPTSTARTLMRSTRNPAGICSVPETTLNAISATELHVAHAELGPHQRKQRKHQVIVMADEMRRADQGDDPEIPGGVGKRRQWWSASWPRTYSRASRFLPCDTRMAPAVAAFDLVRRVTIGCGPPPGSIQSEPASRGPRQC